MDVARAGGEAHKKKRESFPPICPEFVIELLSWSHTLPGDADEDASVGSRTVSKLNKRIASGGITKESSVNSY